MDSTCVEPSLVHLRAGGTSVLLTAGATPPAILHWGRDLGALTPQELAAVQQGTWPHCGDSVVNTTLPSAILPQLADGWLGLVGVECDRDGRDWAPRFATSTVTTEGHRAVVGSVDDAYGLAQRLEIEVEASGLVRVAVSITNTGTDPLDIRGVNVSVPVPSRASTVLDFAGGWANERHPQAIPLNVGRWTRESRGGKPGLDGPLLMVAGTADVGFGRGEAWAIHLAWSGNQHLSAERTFTDVRRLIAGEILHPGEVRLNPGETYRSPELYASWGEGLDEVAARFHAHLRGLHPDKAPAPVVLNTWEAMYFRQEPERFAGIARAAAQIGVELLVVDDGWFRGRQDDTSSLGDWFVDPTTWPEGLRPFRDLVHELGMGFGLWIEPEMVSRDSDLARAHPDWLFDAGHGVGVASRHQYGLDLSHPEAYAWIRDRLDGLVTELSIDYLKWDHNRYLLDAGSRHRGGRAGLRSQTTACHRLMSDLRRGHPELRIESCAAGGGRIDLEILRYADRVWPSDSNDPHERLRIQRWTTLLLAPEYQGTHIGAATAHTSGRTTSLDFRAAVAVWGNLGVEMDITGLDHDQLSRMKRWIAVHKALRPLIHTGTVCNADRNDDAVVAGVVSPDRRSAAFLYAVRTVGTTPCEPIRFQGLDPSRRYRMTVVAADDSAMPPWASHPEAVYPGEALMTVGVAAPNPRPDTALVVHLADATAPRRPWPAPAGDANGVVAGRDGTA